MALNPTISAISWIEKEVSEPLFPGFGKVRYLDQTLLPSVEKYLECNHYRELIKAIQCLAIRGAPLIGVAGAYGAILILQESLKLPIEKRLDFCFSAFSELENARPTAVNLRWAVSYLKKRVEELLEIKAEHLPGLLAEAKRIHLEDIQCNRRIAEWGSPLLVGARNIITICNTGDLATGGIGTAFGVIRAGFIAKDVEHVFALETRPVLQGMRLTSWELKKNGIPFSMLCDNMAAYVMKKYAIGAVLTGADRIAENGDAANKIGTYQLALLAKHHGIPFYVVAPFSTFDLNLSSGEKIPIEERHSEEVFSILGKNIPDFPMEAVNPSFDVTPASLISAIICDKGVITHPTSEKIHSVLSPTKVHSIESAERVI